MKLSSACTFLLLIFTTQILYSQAQLMESVVIDEESKVPIPYATIIYPDQQYGFSANADGYFRIRVGSSEHSKKIRISSIGYEQYNTTLGNMLKQQTDTVFLKPKVTILKEILVKAETETPQSMIENAARNLKDFLGKDPYYLHVRYQEEIKKDKQFVGFTEAEGLMHVSGYQSGYNKRNELFAYDLAQWKHLRRVLYLVPSACNREKDRTLGIEKLMKAKARYLYEGPFDRNNMDNFKYTIDSLTSFNDNDVFIISFEPLGEKSSFAGQAYIKVDDYALIGLRVTEKNAKETLDENCDITPTSTFNLTFTEISGRYYLKNIALNLSYRWNNTTISENLILNGEEFNENETVDLNYDQRMVVYNEMINPSIAYNDSFWQEHGNNLPKNLDDDLGKKMSLQKQFLQNSGKRPIPLPEDVNNYEELYRNRDLFRLFVNDEF